MAVKQYGPPAPSPAPAPATARACDAEAPYAGEGAGGPNARYPDIGDILAAKAAWRRKQASLTFAEKLDILDRLRENELTFGPELRDAATRARKSEQP